MKINNDSTLAQGKEIQALVIGGGIAGLLTARVLSDYYEQILVVDRDVFPEQPQLRAGTPQAFHVHRVLARGTLILERLFPNYTDELLAEGAYPIQNTEMRVTTPHGSLIMRQLAKGASYSRALLEWDMRQRVQALPNVRFLPNQEVIGLQISPDRDRITGMLLRERGHLEQQTTITDPSRVVEKRST
jgi:2-polyprenyl-6-methoxyphenol hydroxylase-like FAD-dependent oxidoreductase